MVGRLVGVVRIGLPLPPHPEHRRGDQRPNSTLNIEKIMPEVNIVNARIPHDCTNGSVSAPSHQSTRAAIANPPSKA
ncbi:MULTISPECIES: hypothetical protein [Nocardia]|uniref:Uncharacterized protein n=1 Tax=Nocardia nova TaxID=37330 RepID=A0A2T2Z9W4_9NOCA|nr:MULTISPECIES: hypothetical protein [Nocardia]PSR64547.1 hypothetical protein C8259_05770 [Nocardia nova]